MLAHLSASPAADALSRAASLQGVCVRRESLFPKLTECQGRASTPTLSAKTRPRAQGEGFSSQCRTCEEQGWGEPVLLPRCCLCSAWEPLPASAEFPAARSASNLGKEKPSLALETQPTHLLCQSWCLQLPSDQVSGFSPALHSMGCASTGMPEHSRSSVHRNRVSAPHKPFPKAVDLLLLPSGNHRRSHPHPLGCPLQPSHPAEPLTIKPNEALLME